MPTPPIIIIRKKGGHGGHHGGAWKVAYADFVTAMMALFIVLWLMNSSKQLQVAVGGYFKDPTGTAKKVGSNQSGSGESFPLTKKNLADLKEQLQKNIRSINDLEKLRKNIEMTVTAEGLRIELLESDKGTFFDSGSSALNGERAGNAGFAGGGIGEACPITFQSKATPMRSRSRKKPTTATGSFRRTARMRHGG